MRAITWNEIGAHPAVRVDLPEPSPEILGRIAQHLADGTLTVPIEQTYDLAQASDALHALGANHTRGKLAPRVGAPEAPQ
jgi:NADPH:quinone reductase-like Zn-dependent oxidoreductase